MSDVIRGNSRTAENREHQTKSIRWYVIGLAVVGATAGYFAGLSDSPVVATLLPLLFGLIGGSSGLLLLVKSASRHTRHQLNIVGKALILFCIPCVVASILAVSARTGAAISEFLPSLTRASGSSGLGSGSSSDIDLRLALLDAKLAGLGVDASSRRTVVQKAASELEGKTDSNVRSDLELLKLKAEALLEVLRPIVGPDDERADDQLRDGYVAHPVVDDLVRQLRVVILVVPQWLHPAPNGEVPRVPRATISGLVSELAANLKLFPGRPVARRPRPVDTMPVYDWIFRYAVDFDYRRLIDYEKHVYALESRYMTGDWIGDKTLAEALDEYLTRVLTRDVPEESRARPHFKP
jgi:hypothetical protein